METTYRLRAPQERQLVRAVLRPEWNLTPPTSGRARGRFGLIEPPLMSNVRPRMRPLTAAFVGMCTFAQLAWANDGIQRHM